MSWNPGATIPSANWQGNAPLVTQRQLYSTVAGLETEIINSSTVNLSTLIVPDWISTTVLYVSDIQGAKIDISGIIIDASGVFYAPNVSSSQGQFNITLVSSLQLKGIDLGGINVSFDLGLGQAIGGLAAGLGALVGGAFIGVGTGVGLAIQGAEQGIGTIIAGRPQNFINSNVYETINFTSQLQVSTLGNAYPLYSSIFRTVSSSSANQVPGLEIFTSTFFQPGQICVRTASDPINLITGDSNLNTSTIQSFGQWVPLVGLEPDAIVGNSVSTNFLSTGTAFISSLLANHIVFQNAATGANVGIDMGYDAAINYNLGSVGQARQLGSVNYWWNQTNQDIVWSQLGNTGSVPINAQLSLGSNANESYLQISSIFSRGNIQGNSGNFSTLFVNSLTVLSTINTTSTNVENITSTATLYADQAFLQSAYISSLAPFKFFSTTLGNPNGFFDITRTDVITSTTYASISSLQQNILNYSFSALVNDEASFNALTPQAEIYTVSPTNVSQWGSTMLIANPGADIGGAIDITWSTSWTQAGFTGGQFDLFVDMRTEPFSIGAAQLGSADPNQPDLTTFFYTPPTIGYCNSYRFTLAPTGVWSAVTPAPPPPVTSNNNTFQIYQDINDTYIKTTDRLHLQGGDILFDGNVSFSNVQLDYINVDTAILTSTFAENINVSTLASQRLTNQYNFYGSLNSAQPITPINFTYSLTSTDFVPVRNLVASSRGPNMFNSLNVGEWSNVMFATPTGTTTGNAPIIYLGDLTPTTPGYGPAYFWVNNITAPPIPIALQVIKQPGSWLSTLGYASPAGTGYTLVGTGDGVNWFFQSNRPYPGGTAAISYSNQYQLAMNANQTQLTVGQPFAEIVSGTKTIQANKVVLAANQIRTISYASPSYPPRECGFDQSSYFDGNVIFTGTQSDAINVIPTPLGQLAYSVVGWSALIVCGRMRTESLGIQGFEFEAVVVNLSGTFADFVWASHRYINVNGAGPTANIREIYYMTPMNWTVTENLVGPY